MNATSEKISVSEEPSLAEKRRSLVNRYLNQLVEMNPQLYYESTSTIARAVHHQFTDSPSLSEDEASILKQLSVRDIELILAFRQ